jgi:hypothetical protein
MGFEAACNSLFIAVHPVLGHPPTARLGALWCGNGQHQAYQPWKKLRPAPSTTSRTRPFADALSHLIAHLASDGLALAPSLNVQCASGQDPSTQPVCSPPVDPLHGALLAARVDTFSLKYVAKKTLTPAPSRTTKGCCSSCRGRWRSTT